MSGRMKPPELPLWELIQTSHVVARRFRELFARFGLTPTQVGVLACLQDGDDFTKASLARAVLVTPQSMDPLIDSLLSRGLVSRTSVGGRGRAAGITITAAGIELLLRVRPAVAELNAPGRIGVPENELPLLIAQLRAMRAHLAAPDCAAGR